MRGKEGQLAVECGSNRKWIASRGMLLKQEVDFYNRIWAFEMVICSQDRGSLLLFWQSSERVNCV